MDVCHMWKAAEESVFVMMTLRLSAWLMMIVIW